MAGPEPAPIVAAADPQRAPAPPEPAAPKAPAVPNVETFVIPADAVMGLEIERSISSETAHVEDHVEARVTRDVRGDGNVVLIPAGTRVRGEVTLVESGGKFKERARLAIRFHTLLLTDGQSVPIATDPLVREGDNVGQRTGTRIGASAAGGAIIGAIFGGQKGAAIGAAAGAGAGTAATAASRASEARFRAGSVVTVRLTAPVSITIEQ
jgi:type IV secretory pathway VirB10-like protein